MVQSFPEKAAAERATKSVDGVTAIANDVVVKPTFVSTDPEIEREVLQALKAHAFVPDDHIKATVRDWFVTLEGTAEWNYQRSSTERVIHYLKRVRGVINEIRIKVSLSPSMVNERIEQVLHRSAELLSTIW